jgi:predicted metal-binding protein
VHLDQPGIVSLHICTTCQGDEQARPAECVSGQALHDAVCALLSPSAEAALRVRGVACLANCTRGCSAAISGAGKWSYLLGYLSPQHAPDLLAYASLYARSETGTVLPSRRAASLRDSVLGRIPSVDQCL